MGHRCAVGLLVLLITLTSCNAWSGNVDYTERIISALNNHDTVLANEIFDFQFDRAYVLDDPYISGDDFTEKYDLGISIAQVEQGKADYIQRIVFVNNNGDFIYEYQCYMGDICIIESGFHEFAVVFYPGTVIERISNTDSDNLAISLNEAEILQN